MLLLFISRLSIEKVLHLVQKHKTQLNRPFHDFTKDWTVATASKTNTISTKGYRELPGKTTSKQDDSYQQVQLLKLLQFIIVFNIFLKTGDSLFSLMTDLEITVTEEGSNIVQQNSDDSDSNLIFETLNHSEPLGLYDPFSKIYITLEPIPNVALYLSLTVINQLHKLTYSKSLGQFTYILT